MTKFNIIKEYEYNFINCEEIIFKNYIGSGIRIGGEVLNYKAQNTLLKKRSYFIKDATHRIYEMGIISSACKNSTWKTALEIGVGWGLTSLNMAQILVNRKDANDTFFQTIDYGEYRNQISSFGDIRQKNIREIKNHINYNNWEHSDIGSDEWFLNNKNFKCDIVFIDGCHTYEQTKKDWINVERSLNENGIVFFHDLNKRTEGNQYPKVALKLFEEIDSKIYTKIILHTPFRLGVLCEKKSKTTNKWIEETVENLGIKYDRLT